MKLINGDKIVTAQLYDDEYEEFKEEKMSIIDYVNAYTNEGVTTDDDVLDKIRAEIGMYEADCILADDSKECKECDKIVFGSIYRIIDRYRNEVSK